MKQEATTAPIWSKNYNFHGSSYRESIFFFKYLSNSCWFFSSLILCVEIDFLLISHVGIYMWEYWMNKSKCHQDPHHKWIHPLLVDDVYNKNYFWRSLWLEFNYLLLSERAASVKMKSKVFRASALSSTHTVNTRRCPIILKARET